MSRMSAIVYFIAGTVTLLIAQRITRFTRMAAIVILLLPLLFTGRALSTGGVYGPVDLAYTAEPLASIASSVQVGAVSNPGISDVYTEFMPWNDALRRAIARREWPLWNPYELCGAPLAGAAQSAPYHPITLIGLLVPLRQYFAFAAAMALMSAALTAFLFFREFVASETAALFGAAAWMCSSHLLFFAGTALILAVSITPLVLLGARRIVREPGGRSTAILTTALLLILLAGHPESALHVVSFAIVYFVFEIAITRSPSLRRAILCGVVSGALALLLAAIFLLPLFQVIRHSEEYVHRALGYRQVSSTSAQMFHRLGANLFPFLEGAPGVEEPQHSPAVRHGWLATAYVGSIVFAPALLAMFYARSRERWFFLAAVIGGLAAGIAAPPAVYLLSRVPGFSISVNDRIIAYAALGFCALAAMGLDAWDKRLVTAFGIVAAAIFIAALIAVTKLPADYVELSAGRALLPVILAAAAVAILPARQAAMILFALLLIQRGGEAAALQPTLPARAFYPRFAGLDVMRSDQPFRIVAVGTMLPPELSTHYGLEDVRGFSATTFFRLQQTYRLWSVIQPVWSNRVDRLDSPMLSLMNVRFALAPPSLPLPEWWKARAAFPAYVVAENSRVLPRAFVPRTVRVDIDGTDSLRSIATINDFGEQSVIEDVMARDYTPNGPGTVTVRRDRGGHLELSAHMAGPGWVIVSNAFWRGWRARSEGKRLRLRFGNHAFIAFYLPAGDHDVRLVYRPRRFVLGAWISALTALLVLAYALMPSSVMTFFISVQTSFFADGVRSRYAG